MPVTLHMTWVASGRRWTKKYGGKWYAISCRKLGVPETKEGSWRAANAWWEQQQAIADIPPEDDRLERATRISHLVRDFSKLDDNARREAVEALLGAGAYDSLKSQRDTVLATMTPPTPERTIASQVGNWKSLLHSACQSGQLSEGRYDAYCRNIGNFVNWIGQETSIDGIDEARLEAFYAHLSTCVATEKYSPTYAHTLLMTAKQFIARLAEMKLIPLPGNIRSRRFRFNHGVAAKIETFTATEVRQMLEAATDRTRLYLLLCLNVGMYQNDIAELRKDEVNWSKGTITRQRSKLRERGGPVVTYKLWPETLALLTRQQAEGDLVLTTTEGNPLVEYSLKTGKFARYDAIQSAWNRLGEKMGGKIRLSIKHLRKTSATILGEHPQFKFYANHFLADSPKSIADKHYVRANDVEFFEALDWLRGRILLQSDDSVA